MEKSHQHVQGAPEGVGELVLITLSSFPSKKLRLRFVPTSSLCSLPGLPPHSPTVSAQTQGAQQVGTVCLPRLRVHEWMQPNFLVVEHRGGETAQ